MTVTNSPRTDGSLLRAALSVAARGWHVFPCLPGGKRPALRDNWQRLATTDPARILRWWTRTPFNIGISCGQSGLVVIDLDVASNHPGSESPASGADSLIALCHQHGQPYPDRTFTVSTPSGGIHLYFEAPCQPLRNSTSRLGPLIDIRAAGGYVVAPGSRVGGLSYEVGNAAYPASLPRWVAHLLKDSPAPAVVNRCLPSPGTHRATRYALAALREEIAKVAAARPGIRNDTLNRAAFSLGQLVATSQLPAAAVTTALAEAAESCGLPGEEAQRTIRSGMTSGARHPRASSPPRLIGLISRR
jgi:hypothetical protein